jgi:hypothetical protein
VELTDRLRAWTYARQRLGDPARSLEQALRAVVAVYATHPTAPLALWARTASFSPARYRRLDRDRVAVRIPAMRHTVFLVPRANAARVFTATRASRAHARGRLKQYGLSIEDYERLAARILESAREPKTARDLGGTEVAPVLRGLRFEGRLLTLAGEGLLMSPHRFVAASSWLPEELDAGDPAEALAWLAAEYLRAYGPARVEDFRWWTGAPKRAAATALGTLETIDLGDGLLLPVDDEPAFGRVTRALGNVDLLPKWDAYTMGHAPDGRVRFVHPDVQARVYTPIGTGLAGDGNPVVLVNGKAVGTWTFTRKDGAEVQMFDGVGPRTMRRVNEKLEAVAGLLMP